MQIFHFDRETGEYAGASDAALDPLETKLQGRNIFLFPAHSTTVLPPDLEEGMARVFNGSEWLQVEDHRGVPMYSKVDGHQNSMIALGPIPEDYTLDAPLPGLIRPRLEDGDWTETAIVFQGREVASKADVDRITRQRIADIGEEKAKTEKILAGSGPCQIWDDFISQRAVILQEGDAFILAHDLT